MLLLLYSATPAKFVPKSKLELNYRDTFLNPCTGFSLSDFLFFLSVGTKIDVLFTNYNVDILVANFWVNYLTSSFIS